MADNDVTDYVYDPMRCRWRHPDSGVGIDDEHMPSELLPGWAIAAWWPAAPQPPDGGASQPPHPTNSRPDVRSTASPALKRGMNTEHQHPRPPDETVADLPTRVADLIADALDGAVHLLEDDDDAQQVARLADHWRTHHPGDLARIEGALTPDRGAKR